MHRRSIALVVAVVLFVVACGTPDPVATLTPPVTSTVDSGQSTATASPVTPASDEQGPRTDRGPEGPTGLTADELAIALTKILTDPIEATDDPAAPAISRGLTTIGMSDDVDLAPYVVDMMGVAPFGIFYRQHAGDVLGRLTREAYAEDWFSWVQWVADHPELEPGPAYVGWKRALLASMDSRFATFFPTDAPHTIRIEEIVWGGVPAVDGILSLDDPPFIAAADAHYLDPDEHVFGVSVNGDSRAYPLRIMNWHEMANDTVGDVPVALAYCTLCNSAILFDRRRGDETLTFGSSGLLYRSNKLMFDASTRSLWGQFTGTPVVGELVGRDIQLRLLAVVRTTWEEWPREHPDTTALALETGYERAYLKPGTEGAVYAEYFSSPFLMFPTSLPNASQPLPAKAEVFVIAGGGGDDPAKAYPLVILERLGVINDSVGGRPVVVVRDAGGGVRAYERPRPVEFSFEPAAPSSDQLVDDGGTTWTALEHALVSDNGTVELARVPGHVAYWFAFAAFRPDAQWFGAPSAN